MRINERGRQVKVYYIDASILWRVLRGEARITNMPLSFSSVYVQWVLQKHALAFLVECEDFPIVEQGEKCDEVMAQCELLPVYKEKDNEV